MQKEHSKMGYRIAVVGATGNVGHEMLNILAERAFPVDEIVAWPAANRWEQKFHLAIKP